MRSIKFRVWNKEAKEWVKKEDFTMYLDGSICVDRPWGCYEIHNNEKFIAEQFTGLLDKHGEEVYEGDILEAIGYKGIVKFGKHNKKKDLLGYDYAEVGFYLEYITNYGKEYKLASSWHREAAEVIGNIHEDKNLK